VLWSKVANQDSLYPHYPPPALFSNSVSLTWVKSSPTATAMPWNSANLVTASHFLVLSFSVHQLGKEPERVSFLGPFLLLCFPESPLVLLLHYPSRHAFFLNIFFKNKGSVTETHEGGHKATFIFFPFFAEGQITYFFNTAHFVHKY